MRFRTKQRLADIFEFNEQNIPQIQVAINGAGYSFNHGEEPEGLWGEAWFDGYWQNMSVGDYVVVTQDSQVIVADRSYVDDLYEPYEDAQSLGGPLQGEWTT